MMIPKGKLISIGGNEDKGADIEPDFLPGEYFNFFEAGVLRRFLNEMKGTTSKVGVITTASLIPEEVGDIYLDGFTKLGCKDVHIMNIKSREDANSPRVLELLKEVDGLIFSGGNQLRLSMIFGGTEFVRTMVSRYHEEEFVIAGTSAGAMVMSNTMIYQGNSAESLLKGEVKISTGFGLLNNVIIDTHFVKRGRFGRLAQAIAGNPGCVGIGLGENTGVIVKNGHHLEAIGFGLVIILDGHGIKHSNMADVMEGAPLSIENMVMHVMSKGNCYDIKDRKFYPLSILEIPHHQLNS